MIMSDWKDKLEAMDNMPGLDKSTAWEKLYPRLEVKPRRRPGFYWMAAAASLVPVIIMTMLLNKQQGITEPENVVIKTNSVTPVVVPARNTIPVAENKIQVTNVAAAKTANVLPKIMGRTNPTISRNSAIANKITPEPQELVITNPSPMLPGNDVPVVMPKKKLRVVHINELGNPVPEESIMAQREPRGKIYFQLNNNTSPNSFSLPIADRPGRIIIHSTN